ncbi:MAG: HD domain-containing phosphohydrolase [Geobacteraceae bacterium]
MNSIKIKIIGLITLIVVVIITFAAYLNFQQQKRVITSLTERNQTMLMETIKNSIAKAMLTGHSQEVHNILSQIKSAGAITSIRILGTDGRILNSADSGEIGGIVGQEEVLASRSGKFVQSFTHAELGVDDVTSRITNDPTCHRCHGATKELLGILEVYVSLNYLNNFMSTIKTNSVIATIAIILLIIVTVSVFLIFYVDKPIKQLITSMHEVGKGNFGVRTNIRSSTEMALLSNNYNKLVDRLKETTETAISHDHELAMSHEKLAHHQEIHTMNFKLEAQVNEIELLNISLEERIEEIEEANYKIADLAGELEDKNTNLEKAVARLSTLYKIGLGINSTMHVDRLFNLIVNTSMETLKAQIGYIMLYDQELSCLKITTLHGHDSVVSKGVSIPMTPSGVSTWVVRNCKPLLVADINDTPEFDRSSVLGYERKTLICAPLLVKDEIIGTITVVNKLDNSVYDNEELELLSTIATQASIAIKNAQLYDEQQKTYLNTIHALVSAIEASDSYTRGHSERVNCYSMELAKKLGLPQDRMHVIERASILHDIGKIGIDLTLLHKEGKLTPEDVSDLQQHPTIGMKILEPIEFLSDIRLCIGQHHERYDGQGYPNNTRADELLLEARILAIADSFDAMTSDRPYRKALSISVAVKELQDNAGSQFDPDLIPHFVELLKSGMFTFTHLYDSPAVPAFQQDQTPVSAA